jgi:hypothetical protein
VPLTGAVVSSAAAWALLAYSFLPRPESISSELTTTSVFQCLLDSVKFDPLSEGGLPLLTWSPQRCAAGGGSQAPSFHSQPSSGSGNDAHERVMRHAAAITAETWREVGTIPWYGPEHSLNDLVVYTMLRSFRGAADVLARPVHAEDLPVRPLRE